MPIMAKKKQTPPPPAPEPEAKKKDQHRSTNMIRQEDDVYNAMRDLAEENDRPMTREVRQALIAWLTAKGKWPPATSI